MLKVQRHNQFKKDYKLCCKRGKEITRLDAVIEMLVSGVQLPFKYRDHSLIGNYKGRRECHIEPDWLLIYKLDEDALILERTGTHSDLFE